MCMSKIELMLVRMVKQQDKCQLLKIRSNKYPFIKKIPVYFHDVFVTDVNKNKNKNIIDELQCTAV